jgi:hypothetical protein
MRFTLTQRIAAPAERVFAIASDLDGWPKAIPAITRIERLTEGPVGVGTRFKETRVMFGREATEEMTFTLFEPPHRYRLEAVSCGAHFESTFRFVPIDGGTDVEFSMESRAVSFFAKLMKPLVYLMSGPMKKCLQADLDALKSAAEKATVSPVHAPAAS